MSRAYAAFTATITRCRKLLSLHSILVTTAKGGQLPGYTEADLDELIRMAHVLAVAAMDSYFADKFAELAIPYLKNKSLNPKLAKILEDGGLNLAAVLEMVKMDRPHRRIRTILDTYLEKYVSQREDSINRLFAAYGKNNFCTIVEKRLGRTQMIQRIMKLVLRRHKIVHQADLNDQWRVVPIDVGKVQRGINLIEIFIESAEDVANTI